MEISSAPYLVYTLLGLNVCPTVFEFLGRLSLPVTDLWLPAALIFPFLDAASREVSVASGPVLTVRAVLRWLTDSVALARLLHRFAQRRRPDQS